MAASSHAASAARADMRLCAVLLALLGGALAFDGVLQRGAVCVGNADCASGYCGNRVCEVRRPALSKGAVSQRPHLCTRCLHSP